MEQRSLSPETLAAQALGEADPVSGGLAPVINLSTNYEQQPDGSYPQGRVYTRADNPTSEHAEQLLAALEGGGCACALFGSGMAAATAVFQSCCPAITCWSPGSCTGGCASGWPNSRSPGAWTWSSPTPPIWTRWPRRSGPAGPGCSGWRRRPTRCGRSPTWPPSASSRTRPGPGRRGQHGGHAGADPAVRVRRRPGGALGHQVPQRARRRAGRRRAGRPPGSVLGTDPVLAPQRRGDAGAVRGVAAAARHAHAVPAHAPRVADRPGHRHPLPWASRAVGGALPGAAGPSGAPGRRPADARRVRRDAVHPARRRSRARAGRAARGPGVQARHLPGRGGKPDRAPAQQ